MSRFREFRERLGLTQAEVGVVVGRTQGNVGHYERGQAVPADVARKLLAFAKARGVAATYEDIYGPVDASNDAAPQGEAA